MEQNLTTEKKKQAIAMIIASCFSANNNMLRIRELQRRRHLRLQQLSILMLSVIKKKKSAKMWMKERRGQFWELDVAQGDEEFFKSHFCMSYSSFKILCAQLKGSAKRDTSFRVCIPLEKRIAIALYTLTSSDKYQMVARLFGVSTTRVCRITAEFCSEIWTLLAPKYLKSDFLTQERVDECVEGFEKIGFPQCLGAIDGCHIEIDPPAKEAADYFNYKGWYSTVLLALVDHRNRFMYINVGAPGRCDDSQIFEKSALKKVLLKTALLKENSKTISNVNVPVLILGDSAFRFSTYLMKPYPVSTTADKKENKFNYKLSKARRVVGNAFGQLKERFPRIGKGIDSNIRSVNAIIKCCCVLHNFLIEHNDIFNASTYSHKEHNPSSCRDQPEEEDASTDSDSSAIEIRDAIAKHLCSRQELSSNNNDEDEASGVDDNNSSASERTE